MALTTRPRFPRQKMDDAPCFGRLHRETVR